ncbi:hypothetical protein KC298_08610 [Listeria monocytogenes]|uniref:hypothetical protein n=2 Tax=Listeria monocytogenes TaxID=1639 RepID=UPI000BE07DD4|nr:hypothetical protein [Listeria monocytogenes]AVV07516.1 hypothetical protein CXL08_11245 [Listeria monocytogenes]EAD6207611.1 hypothetical protein [Listeria monocytogenes]EAD6220823.1 hypothetical protein [Listeria monocytogenes]EAD9670745.1 hypothetical protein [Listeria monocytogenes]EAE3096161.1 hypothetical protein [Listeria monocytogenes]
MNNGQWMITCSDDKFWEGSARFNTKEEAIGYGIEMLRKYNSNPDDAKNRKILTDDMGAYPVPLTPYSNEPIYIFNVGLVEQVKFPNRTDELLERIAEDVYDEIGDYAEDYLDDVDEKHQTELQELIRDWAERHDYLPNYFTISLTELIDTRNLEEV